MSTFPQPFESTVSYWQATNCEASSLYNHGRDSPLPESAEIVIIGAGMTGAGLAYQLTRRGYHAAVGKIVVLEAKDVASGATGRNGGHVRPGSFLSYPGLVGPLSEGGAGHTSQEAIKILEDEEENMRLVGQIVRDEKLNEGRYAGVQWELRDSIVVYRTKEECDSAKAALKEYQAARLAMDMEHESEIEFYDDQDQAKRVSRTGIALACSITKAAIVHPHRLATALLNIAMRTDHCDLYSHTPVQSISKDDYGGWIVQTGRGMIKAAKVVLASNAHTEHIWDTSAAPFKDLITTCRAHCCTVTPPTSYRGAGAITHSLAFGGTYLRDAACGIIMCCGAATLREYGLATRDQIYGVVDDSIVLPNVENYFRGVLSDTYQDWEEKGRGEGLIRAWSGIMGYSRDKLPFIGPIPDQQGLYAAVAFHGHGMSRILCCTRALASQILSPNDEWDSRLPRSFEITDSRIKRALAVPATYTAQPALAEQGLPGKQAASSCTVS